ncbi:zinc finger and BTB domain-containing protein 49-like [Cylas formicarius]|uniref:zinc finger and BTB domain-containing protein 49-like n=1 Tax=Cylas formicarius TaxID=197179 RepID=UPI002958CBEC|nr:zinc finger and BTB domain-containing protein 49-like [Cylas formicarius]
MLENSCPQCKNLLHKPSNRLVQDSCGHKKCRSCLLEDEERCKQCIVTNGRKIDKLQFEHQTGVIQCNGRPHIKLATETGGAEDNDKAKEQKTDNICNGTDTGNDSGNDKDVFKLPKKADTISKDSDIPKHVNQRTDPISFYCTICCKSFQTRAHVKYHKYCSGEIKPHKCNTCGKEFVLKNQLHLHLFKHKEGQPLTCIVCNKTFCEKSKLNRHMSLHSPEKRHLCTECGKRFRSKESLKIHLTIHRGDKAYICKLCPAKFNNSSNLKRHLVTHSKEKVHMCDQCGKRFKLKWALFVHRRSHLRIRPFECSICPKTFVNNKDLQRHKLIHIESKGFICSICDMSFRRRDNLRRHIKNTHPGKKGEIIKKVLNPPDPPVKKSVVVDNPNAIHVITASPACLKSKAAPVALSPEPSVKSVDSRRVGSVINGPIKLAFKTPAFKSHYNITRDCDYVPSPQIPKPIDLAESVDICQKILSPSTDFCAQGPRKIDEKTSTEICQKILSISSSKIETDVGREQSLTDYPSNLHYATSFQNQKHAMIKNIKFKVPARYTNLFKQTTAPEDETAQISLPSSTKQVETSVIVNKGSSSDLHWRRRTSQNLVVKY